MTQAAASNQQPASWDDRYLNSGQSWAPALSNSGACLQKQVVSGDASRKKDYFSQLAQHKRIADRIGTDFFVAHPYCSWERGANENMNGLIRHFFFRKECASIRSPKSMSSPSLTISIIDHESVLGSKHLTRSLWSSYNRTKPSVAL